MIKKTIRWGMVGCGDVTEKKSGPGFQKSVGSELVAVMRRNGNLAKDYALRHGVRKWYDDGAALINDPEVDAVYIATPPGSHKEYALMAADVGKPVYVEKPMARNYAQSAEMVAYFKERGVPLFVAYYRRAQEKFLIVRDLLKAGTIGDVRLVRVTQFQSVRDNELNPSTIPWRLLPEISGGGHFVDMASHSIDMLDFLFGPIAKVSGFASNQAGLYPAEDIVTGSWKFASGIHGVGSWCFTLGEALDVFEIFGSCGHIAFSVFGSEPIQLASTIDGSPVIQNIQYATPEHVGQPLIQLVVRELLGEKGICPSTGESALRAARILDEIRGMV